MLWHVCPFFEKFTLNMQFIRFSEINLCCEHHLTHLVSIYLFFSDSLEFFVFFYSSLWLFMTSYDFIRVSHCSLTILSGVNLSTFFRFIGILCIFFYSSLWFYMTSYDFIRVSHCSLTVLCGVNLSIFFRFLGILCVFFIVCYDFSLLHMILLGFLIVL